MPNTIDQVLENLIKDRRQRSSMAHLGESQLTQWINQMVARKDSYNDFIMSSARGITRLPSQVIEANLAYAQALNPVLSEYTTDIIPAAREQLNILLSLREIKQQYELEESQANLRGAMRGVAREMGSLVRTIEATVSINSTNDPVSTFAHSIQQLPQNVSSPLSDDLVRQLEVSINLISQAFRDNFPSSPGAMEGLMGNQLIEEFGAAFEGLDDFTDRYPQHNSAATDDYDQMYQVFKSALKTALQTAKKILTDPTIPNSEKTELATHLTSVFLKIQQAGPMNAPVASSAAATEEKPPAVVFEEKTAPVVLSAAAGILLHPLIADPNYLQITAVDRTNLNGAISKLNPEISYSSYPRALTTGDFQETLSILASVIDGLKDKINLLPNKNKPTDMVSFGQAGPEYLTVKKAIENVIRMADQTQRQYSIQMENHNSMIEGLEKARTDLPNAIVKIEVLCNSNPDCSGEDQAQAIAEIRSLLNSLKNGNANAYDSDYEGESDTEVEQLNSTQVLAELMDVIQQFKVPNPMSVSLHAAGFIADIAELAEDAFSVSATMTSAASAAANPSSLFVAGRGASNTETKDNDETSSAHPGAGG